MRRLSVRKILVLRGGALGDFIVTLPALAMLRHAWPEAEIDLVGNASAASLAVNRWLLTRAHSQHDARWAALYDARPLPSALREWLSRFDAVVNFWPDPDGVAARHFPVCEGQRFAYASAAPESAPAAAHFCAALAPLGLHVDATYFPLRPLQPAPASRMVAIHPGSGSRRKNWPLERWLELVTRVADPILLITGEAEADAWSARALERTPLGTRLRDGTMRLAHRLPLEELVTQLAACRLFLGHDSGISHLAAASGVPCVLLFGPTDPAMWAPPAAHVRVLHHGRELTAISIDDVFTAMR